jgi:hypothetical protein
MTLSLRLARVPGRLVDDVQAHQFATRVSRGELVG